MWGQIVVWLKGSIWICSVGFSLVPSADYFSALILRKFVSLVLELSGYLGLLLALEPNLTRGFGALADRGLLFSFCDFPGLCWFFLSCSPFWSLFGGFPFCPLFADLLPVGTARVEGWLPSFRCLPFGRVVRS